MEKQIKIGDIVTLNIEARSWTDKPQMVVYEIKGDLITCDHFNRLSGSIERQDFHVQQLVKLIKRNEN
jgi:uncharacterized protein YodC (DUF2158 family)